MVPSTRLTWTTCFEVALATSNPCCHISGYIGEHVFKLTTQLPHTRMLGMWQKRKSLRHLLCTICRLYPWRPEFLFAVWYSEYISVTSNVISYHIYHIFNSWKMYMCITYNMFYSTAFLTKAWSIFIESHLICGNLINADFFWNMRLNWKCCLVYMFCIEALCQNSYAKYS